LKNWKINNFIFASLIISYFVPRIILAKTLINCSEASPTSFNPQQVIDAPSFNASAITLYNKLMGYEWGSTKLIPILAKNVVISKDQLTYTFELKNNVSFHQTDYFKPTRPLNVDDVLFSFNRMRDESHPYYKIGGGVYTQFEGNIGKNIKEIVKLSDLKFKIILDKPQAIFLTNLAGNYMSILSKEYADFLQKENRMSEIDLKPIGTGPFKFESFLKDSYVKFSRHENYFQKDLVKTSNVDKLIFSITPDPSVRFQKLKRGECHFVTLPHLNDLPEMKKNTQLKVLEEAGLNIGYLAFNMNHPLLKIKNVREAISKAINKKSYLSIIYKDQAIEANQPLPPGLFARNEKLGFDDYNPVAALKMIQDLKLSQEQLKLDLTVLPVVRPYNPDGKKMAELMQADLKKIGIDLKLSLYDWSTFLKKARSDDHELIMFGWTGNNDPDSFYYDLLSCAAVESGNNTARFCHPKFNELILAARTVSHQKEREKKYLEALKIFKAEMPWVTLFHGKVFRAMIKNLDGYKIDPFGYDYFERVILN